LGFYSPCFSVCSWSPCAHGSRTDLIRSASLLILLAGPLLSGDELKWKGIGIEYFKFKG